MTYEIRQGHVLEKLPEMPESSVHCVITSPPYWGLRDYKLEPMVWGGDAVCEHEWGEMVRTPWANAVSGPNGRQKNTEAGYWKPKETGPTCHKCGAWRGSLGLEPTPELFIEHMVEVFREVRRVLRPDGVCFLNLGDSYAAGGHGGGGNSRSEEYNHSELCGGAKDRKAPACWDLKKKDLCMIPARVAIALQADGWWLRSEIIWSKPNPMPESVTDRPTKAHEMVYLLTKSERYFWDQEAVREPDKGRPSGNIERKHRIDYGGSKQLSNAHQGFAVPWEPNGSGRNIRSVWTIATAPFPEAHFATFPPALVEPMVKAGSREGDTVLDPFAGAGTTGVVSLRLGRDFIGIDLNAEYAEMARKRIAADAPLLNVERTDHDETDTQASSVSSRL